MKLKNIITTAALVLAGTALFEGSASAQSASSPDLILGFQIIGTANPGATTNLEVDLGSSANYIGLDPGTVKQLNVGSGNYVDGGAGGLTAADLVSTYGASWASRTDLLWSVVGSNGGTEVFVTSANPAGLKDVPGNALSTPSGQIAGLYNPFANGTLTGTSTTAETQATTDAGSYTSQLTNAGKNTPGSDFALGYSVQQGVSSTGDAALTLYDVVKNNTNPTPFANALGTFTLGANGSFTYTAAGTPIAAAPEPLGYALVPCAIVLIMVMRRRRTIG